MDNIFLKPNYQADAINKTQTRTIGINTDHNNNNNNNCQCHHQYNNHQICYIPFLIPRQSCMCIPNNYLNDICNCQKRCVDCTKKNNCKNDPLISKETDSINNINKVEDDHEESIEFNDEIDHNKSNMALIDTYLSGMMPDFNPTCSTKNQETALVQNDGKNKQNDLELPKFNSIKNQKILLNEQEYEEKLKNVIKQTAKTNDRKNMVPLIKSLIQDIKEEDNTSSPLKHLLDRIGRESFNIICEENEIEPI